MAAAPCRRNCCLDHDDICLGCGRSLAEITGWHSASQREQQQIVLNAQARLVQKNQQRETSWHPLADPSE